MAKKKQSAPPAPSKKRGRQRGLGEWYRDPGSRHETWLADSTSGDPTVLGGKVRVMNGKWRGAGISYLAYRDGLYLGYEDTMEAAQARAERGERKESANIVEHARMVEVSPRQRAKDEQQSQAAINAALIRTSLRGDRKAGKRKVEVNLDRDKRIKLLVTVNPRRPGSGAHARFAKLMEFDGKSVGSYLDSGGNPETLSNAASDGRAAME